MVLDAAGLSSQSRTRVRSGEDRNREAWQPWRGWRVESRAELTSLPAIRPHGTAKILVQPPAVRLLHNHDSNLAEIACEATAMSEQSERMMLLLQELAVLKGQDLQKAAQARVRLCGEAGRRSRRKEITR
jgi:hypothetical protein